VTLLKASRAPMSRFCSVRPTPFPFVATRTHPPPHPPPISDTPLTDTADPDAAHRLKAEMVEIWTTLFRKKLETRGKGTERGRPENEEAQERRERHGREEMEVEEGEATASVEYQLRHGTSKDAEQVEAPGDEHEAEDTMVPGSALDPRDGVDGGEMGVSTGQAATIRRRQAERHLTSTRHGSRSSVRYCASFLCPLPSDCTPPAVPVLWNSGTMPVCAPLCPVLPCVTLLCPAPGPVNSAPCPLLWAARQRAWGTIRVWAMHNVLVSAAPLAPALPAPAPTPETPFATPGVASPYGHTHMYHLLTL
jgi:hypothetical protein